MALILDTFAATFTATAVTAAQDVFEITAPSTSRVLIHMVDLGQYSDAGDAEAELLSVQFLRGHTSSGSGGSNATPAPLESGGSAAGSSVETNNTTVASGGSAEVLYASAFNAQQGFIWRSATPPGPIMLAADERFVVRITVPNDSLTMNGTLVFQEIGNGNTQP